MLGARLIASVRAGRVSQLPVQLLWRPKFPLGRRDLGRGPQLANLVRGLRIPVSSSLRYLAPLRAHPVHSCALRLVWTPQILQLGSGGVGGQQSECGRGGSAMGRASSGAWRAVVVLVAAWWVQQAAGQCNKTVPCADATLCCSQFGFCGTADAYCVTGCQNGPCRTTFTPPPPPTPPQPPSPPPPPRPHVSPSPSRGAGRIITRQVFEKLYPNYNKTFYSYDAFIVAARAFPHFLTEGCREQQLRELAAFSAHVQQETAGLIYVEEIDQSDSYCDPTATQYPCAPYQKYFGRGPLQLSWNFNYGPAGKAIGVNILKRPFLVSLDPVVAFKASFWFWNTPRAGGIPSIHDVIIGKHRLTAADKAANRTNGFGYTIDIINGGLECGKGTPTPQAANRVTYFLQFCKLLGVSPGKNLDCTFMKPFA